MKYEHRSQPIIPFSEWLFRMLRALRLALAVVGGALLIGVVGYHVLGPLPWLDSLLEASMILSGMGSIAPMSNDAVKLFASVYALFSGFVAVSSAAIILSPWLHRVLHHLHATPGKDNQNK